MSTKVNKVDTELDDSQVADYLATHPEFFVNRDALLIDLSLPHQPGGAVSLVEKQVSLLRERNTLSKHKLAEFVHMAKANDVIFGRCRYRMDGNAVYLDLYFWAGTAVYDFCNIYGQN